jgi:hypothetical protein
MTDVKLQPGRMLRSGSRLWKVSVAYDYVVDGRRYTGRRLYFASRPVDGMTTARVQALLTRYPPDVQVAVRFDPDRPDRAVLEPRVDWETLPANAVMGVIPLVAVGWALLDLAGLAEF